MDSNLEPEAQHLSDCCAWVSVNRDVLWLSTEFSFGLRNRSIFIDVLLSMELKDTEKFQIWESIRRHLSARPRHSNWPGYTRVHTSILRFDEGLFIDRAIHASRRPFSHVLGSQEVGKSSFFRSVSVPPVPSASFASCFSIVRSFFACSFFYALSPCPCSFTSFLRLTAPVAPPPSIARVPSLIVHFADTVKTRFILVTRHKARPLRIELVSQWTISHSEYLLTSK